MLTMWLKQAFKNGYPDQGHPGGIDKTMIVFTKKKDNHISGNVVSPKSLTLMTQTRCMCSPILVSISLWLENPSRFLSCDIQLCLNYTWQIHLGSSVYLMSQERNPSTTILFLFDLLLICTFFCPFLFKWNIFNFLECKNIKQCPPSWHVVIIVQKSDLPFDHEVCRCGQCE